MVGGVVASYRVLGRIGEGGMGIVYRVEHVLLGRSAALKVLLPEHSQNHEIVARFFNEARAATAIRHPGIVEVYDFGYHHDGSAYIVMELLDGESLARRLARVGRLPFARSLSIVRQIAGALAAAHGKGIVHRDLKPDNVFLVADPEVPGGERIKLLDFGIAKLADDHAGTPHTRTGAVIGTPTYMAPEQCRGVSVDHRADLYSLGVLFFELLCGRPPFTGEGAGDVLAAHIHVPPPPLRSIARDVPEPLEQLALRLLEKAPHLRTPSARRVIDEIDAIAGDAGGGVPVAMAEPVPASRRGTTLSGAVSARARSPRSRSSMWAAPAVLAAVLIAIPTWIAFQDDATMPLQLDGAPAEIASRAPSEMTQATPSSPSGAGPIDAAVDLAVAVADSAATTGADAGAGPAPRLRTVTIDSTPNGAEIVHRGALLGVTPLRTSLPVGDTVLVVRLGGHRDEVIRLRGDDDLKTSLALKKKRIARPSPVAPPDPDRGVNPFK